MRSRSAGPRVLAHQRVTVETMKHLTQVLLALFWKFGGLGLLVLGILDSSFLFAPLGNDLLVVAMTARKHSIPLMLYYAGMSTIGSVLGLSAGGCPLPQSRRKRAWKSISPSGAWTTSSARSPRTPRGRW